jgi:hypothetical protein
MEEPKPKKAKTAVKEEYDDEGGDDDGGQFKEEDEEEDEEQLQMQRNENGESFCDLSRTRRLTVRKFKSAVLVDIREVRGELARTTMSRRGSHHGIHLM